MSTIDTRAIEIEKLRLEFFCSMVHSLRLKTKVVWVGTEYNLTIYSGKWPFLRTVQFMSRETDPFKYPRGVPWMFHLNCDLDRALSSLYRGALQFALKKRGIGLVLDEDAIRAVNEFPSSLARELYVFPTNHLRRNDEYIFWVINSGKPITDVDLQIAKYIMPSANIRLSAKADSCYRYRQFFHLYMEWYFDDIHLPYSAIPYLDII